MVYSKNCKGLSFPEISTHSVCNCNVKKNVVLFVYSVLMPVICHYMDNIHWFMTISPGCRNRPLKALARVNEPTWRITHSSPPSYRAIWQHTVLIQANNNLISIFWAGHAFKNIESVPIPMPPTGHTNKNFNNQNKLRMKWVKKD